MIDDRKSNGKDVGDYLNEKFTKELEIIESINFARNCQSYKEFLGDGICLKLNNVPEERTDLTVSTFYNSWTTSIVLPQDISIVILKNQETGETLDSKYDIINYFISKVSLDEMEKLLYNNAVNENKKQTHLLFEIMSNYYEENRNYLEKFFEKYDIIEIPISSYFNKENIVK